MKFDLPYLFICFAVLVISYLVSITYTSVFYHRAFTHNSLVLSSWFRKFVIFSGPWITGMDIKGWVCMHRMHHEHSDTKLDPHSPVNVGLFGVMMAQMKSYEIVTDMLREKNKLHLDIVSDLDFPLSFGQRKKNIWWIPFAIQIVLAVALAISFDVWLLGISYIAGILSHPIQGWIINSFGHGVGYRNFDRADNSRNNLPAAIFILGEGFQNNHHEYPSSAKFSYRKWEFDPGYLICKILEALGLLKIQQQRLIGAKISAINAA